MDRQPYSSDVLPQRTGTLGDAARGEISKNKVLRSTYALLSMTLLFAAAMAAVSVFIQAPFVVSMGTSIAALALIWFVLPRFENSAAGVGIVFLVTGLLGFGLGPILTHYLNVAGGATLVFTALAGTGAIFLVLSAYVLTTKKDFTFMGGFLLVGMFVVIGAVIANLFLQIPAMSLALSAAIILLMSGFILFDTSRIINGGETNYIRATVGLFLSILNIFTSLLHILGIGGGDD